MDLNDWMLPLIFAVSAAPLFVVAGMLSRGQLHLIGGLDAARVRDPGALSRRLALLVALTGFAVLAGAGGLLWAEGDRDRLLMVALAMLVAINGLAIVIIVAIVRAKRDYLPPRR